MRTTDFLGNEWDIQCMGCAIGDLSMRVPGGILQKTRHFIVHQDPLIPLPGFLVIASLEHIQSISEMETSEFQEFSDILRITHNAIKKATQIESLTLVQEESSFHFHLWFFPWTRPVIESYGASSLAKIRDIMAAYKKLPIAGFEWRELEISMEKIKQYLSAT